MTPVLLERVSILTIYKHEIDVVIESKLAFKNDIKFILFRAVQVSRGLLHLWGN